LEKLKLGELTCAEAIKEAARIIYVAHDEAKDKDFVLEMGYISNETNGKFKPVPKSVLQEAENAAKASLNQEMEQDE
jgi:20S proteasome subunit alpha 7